MPERGSQTDVLMEEANAFYNKWEQLLRDETRATLPPEAFVSDNHILRHAAVCVLASRYPNVENGAEVLNLAMDDPHEVIRAASANTLICHYAAIPDAEERLQKLLHDPHAVVRAAAVRCIRKNFSAIPDASKYILGLANDRDLEVIDAITNIYFLQNPDSVLGEEIMTVFAASQDPEIRSKAAYILYTVGSGLDNSLEWITRLSQDNDEQVRSSAGGTLWSLTVRGLLDANEVAHEFIVHRSPGIKRAVVYILIDKIDDINNPRHILEHAMDGADTATKQTILYAFAKRAWRLLPDCSHILSLLCEDDDSDVRSYAQWIRQEIMKADTRS